MNTKKERRIKDDILSSYGTLVAVKVIKIPDQFFTTTQTVQKLIKFGF